MCPFIIGCEEYDELHIYDDEFNQLYVVDTFGRLKGLCVDRGMLIAVNATLLTVEWYNEEYNVIRSVPMDVKSRGVEIIDNMLHITRYEPQEVRKYDLERLNVWEWFSTDIIMDMVVIDNNIHCVIYHHALLRIYNKEWEIINEYPLPPFCQGIAYAHGMIYITDEPNNRLLTYDKEYNLIKTMVLGYTPHGITYKEE